LPFDRQDASRIANLPLRGQKKARLAFAPPVRMLASLRPVAALLASCFILIAGQGLTSTLVPLGASARGFPDWVIGIMGSSYFVGMLGGAFAAPFVLRAAGHIRAFAALSSVGTVAVVLLPLISDAIFWIAMRAVHGFCIAGLYAAIESWLNTRTEDAWRARVLSFYNIVHFAGSGTGQQALPLAPVTDFTLYALAASFLALSILPLSFTRADPPQPPPARSIRLLRLYRMAPVGAVAAVIIGWANGSFWMLAPLHAKAAGFGPVEIATFITFVIIGCAAAQFPAGFLGDKLDRRLVLAAFAALGAASQIALALSTSLFSFCLFGFLLGNALPTIYVMTSAHTNDRIGREHAVETASSVLFLYCSGALIGPLVASVLMTRFGAPALYWHNAVADLAIVVFVIWRRLMRSPAVPDPEATRIPARIK
jgi:MFS family permease